MRRLLALALSTGCISAVAPRTGEVVSGGDLALGYSVASLSWSPAAFTSSKGERRRYNAGPVSTALALLGGLAGELQLRIGTGGEPASHNFFDEVSRNELRLTGTLGAAWQATDSAAGVAAVAPWVVLWHGPARLCGLFAPCETEPAFDFRDAYGGEVVVGIAIGGR